MYDNWRIPFLILKGDLQAMLRRVQLRLQPRSRAPLPPPAVGATAALRSPSYATAAAAATTATPPASPSGLHGGGDAEGERWRRRPGPPEAEAGAAASSPGGARTEGGHAGADRARQGEEEQVEKKNLIFQRMHVIQLFCFFFSQEEEQLQRGHALQVAGESSQGRNERKREEGTKINCTSLGTYFPI